MWLKNGDKLINLTLVRMMVTDYYHNSKLYLIRLDDYTLSYSSVDLRDFLYEEILKNLELGTVRILDLSELERNYVGKFPTLEEFKQNN